MYKILLRYAVDLKTRISLKSCVVTRNFLINLSFKFNTFFSILINYYESLTRVRTKSSHFLDIIISSHLKFYVFRKIIIYHFHLLCTFYLTFRIARVIHRDVMINYSSSALSKSSHETSLNFSTCQTNKKIHFNLI